MTEPVPSARAEVPEVPEQLDVIIATAMAKRPEDRYRSAAELAAALGQALFAFEGTGPLVAAEPSPDREAPTVVTDEVATSIEHARSTDDSDARPEDQRVAEPSAAAPHRPRSPLRWVAPVIVLSLIGVLIATFSDNPTTSGTTSGTTTSGPAQATAAVKLQGGGLRLGATIELGGLPGGVSIGKRNVWTSLPAAGQLVAGICNRAPWQRSRRSADRRRSPPGSARSGWPKRGPMDSHHSMATPAPRSA
jgi:hypothetical protein